MNPERPEPPEIPEDDGLFWTSDKVELYKLRPVSGGSTTYIPGSLESELELKIEKISREREIEVQKRIRAEGLQNEAERHVTRLIEERDYWMEVAMGFEEQLRGKGIEIEYATRDIDDLDDSFQLEL